MRCPINDNKGAVLPQSLNSIDALAGNQPALTHCLQ